MESAVTQWLWNYSLSSTGAMLNLPLKNVNRSHTYTYTLNGSFLSPIDIEHCVKYKHDATLGGYRETQWCKNCKASFVERYFMLLLHSKEGKRRTEKGESLKKKRKKTVSEKRNDEEQDK